MTPTLPPVGTQALLERLDGYIPDDFLSQLCPRERTGGRRHGLSAAQLWRVHLLALLTTTRSLNLLVAQLPEQAAWRRFARLRRHCPTARMLHEFRDDLGVGGFRVLNQHLLGRLLRRTGVQAQAVALMDATDLAAACSGFKKKFRHLYRRPGRTGWPHAQDRPEPVVRRLQKTHAAPLAAHTASHGDAPAAGQLGDAGQRAGGRAVAAQPALVSDPPGLVAGDRGGRHGVSGGSE